MILARPQTARHPSNKRLHQPHGPGGGADDDTDEDTTDQRAANSRTAATISASPGSTSNAAPASGVNVSAPTTRFMGVAPQPASASAVMIPSPTPALLRPSSSTRMRLASFA